MNEQFTEGSAGNRRLRRLLVAVLSLLLSVTASAAADSAAKTNTTEPRRPIQGLRIPSMNLVALYIPSFITTLGQSSSPFPWYDNYLIDAAFTNLTSKGPNLNLYLSSSHLVSAAAILPQSSNGGITLDTTEQSSNVVDASGVYTVNDFFTIYPELTYTQNHPVSNGALYSDYRYNAEAASLAIGYDSRYDTYEPWYAGVRVIYPDHGFMARAGASYRWYQNLSTNTLYAVPEATAQFQALFPVARFLTLAVGGSGQANLTNDSYRPGKTVTQVIGAYPAVGDYSGKASVELRFLTPEGLTITTPPFLIAPYAFTFSPGVLVGYNAGFAGNYGTAPPAFIQSVYIAPLVAVRINSTLNLVARLDVALSAYPGGTSFAIDFGTSINGTPTTIAQTGL